MPPLPRKPQQIYINRDIDFIIENHIKEETPKLLFVHGQGGVGKSTLLKKFLSCDAKEIPTVLINLQDKNINSFVDILLDEDITSVKHCPNFEKIRSILLKEPKLLNAIIKSNTDVVESKIEEYDKEWGEYAKIAIDGLKFGAKFLKSGEEKKKKEFLNNPEFVLLSALTEDFEEYGLFMVDTFEKIKTNDIKSKINFADSGELSMRLKEKHYRLKDYIEGLIYLLVANSTFIIAGRNSQGELNMEVPVEYTQELSLENFSIANIKELFSIHLKRDSKLSMPSDKHIKQIAELTNGNPLLLGLFPKIAKDYDSWDELNYKEMERHIKTDDEFGLLVYMTDRVLSHLDESKDIWKLVIPRVLNQEIEKLLFKDEKILKELIEVGLATKGRGKDSERYFLHDDVYTAIVAYYERKFKNGFSSWHDAKDVAELHRELMSFYKKYSELHGVNNAFEVCYHKIMLREGFEYEFEVTRKEFSSLALGSLSLNHNEKFRVCKNFDSLSYFQISKLIKVFLTEKNQWYSLLSQKLYSKLLEVHLNGKEFKLIQNIDFLERLKDEFKNDYSYYNVLGEAYMSNEKYDKSIHYFIESLKIKPKNDVVYANIQLAHSKKLDNHDEIDFYINEKLCNNIESCKVAIKTNPKDAEAYYYMGNIYAENEKYDKALLAYQKSIELDSTVKEVYHNLGNTYAEKENYHKAIEFYKEAIKINPKADDSFFALGLSYLNIWDFDNAITKFLEALEINPNNNDVYSAMSFTYDEKQDYMNLNNSNSNDDNTNVYTKIIKVNPNDSSAYEYLFELQLTQNEPFDQKLEKKYIELFQNQKESFIHYEMLKTLQDISHNKEVNIEQWKKKYEGVSFGGWSFNELDKWIDEVEDEVMKSKLQEALEVFKGHG